MKYRCGVMINASVKINLYHIGYAQLNIIKRSLGSSIWQSQNHRISQAVCEAVQTFFSKLDRSNTLTEKQEYASYCLQV